MTVPAIPPLESYVAMDCETVRTRSGHVLAKVGMVDYTGAILLNTFVFVDHRNIVDYITQINGIKPGDLNDAPRFSEVQSKIKAILQDKILVGHAVFNDLAYTEHRHPYEDVRDTALYYPLRERLKVTREGEYPSLKKLYKEVLGQEVQEGVHCPVEDARAALALFLSVREAYETSLARGEECVSGVPQSYAKWFW